MKIAIVGAGAMGCLYGARLSVVEEHQVVLLDVWQEHVDAVRARGLLVEEGGAIFSYRRVTAESRAEAVGPADLAILFVKSTKTAEAMESSRAVFGPDTTVLTLQNGLGNTDIIGRVVVPTNILAGTTAHGATMLGPGKIRHAGFGKTVLGALEPGRQELAERIGALFRRAGLETETSANVMGLVWDKLLVNVGINALTALTGLENGALLRYPELTQLMEEAVREGVSVAKAAGITLGFSDAVAHTREICLATAGNRSSMLQDVANGKETEIDMLNGAVLREGQRYGVDTPVNRVLTSLIRIRQRDRG